MRLLLLYIVSASLLSCVSEKKNQKIQKLKATNPAPIFNSDSAYVFVEQQVLFGPRVISSKAWDECSKYLSKKLESYNAEVKIQLLQLLLMMGKTIL